MAELGHEESEGHAETAALARELGIELIAVGTDRYGVAPVDIEGALVALGQLGDGDAVLVKASRVAGLERLVARLA
jgi:UDP-N-acetylmuramoyl-tripeptide--D-alanyl-D-alanine ligase